MAENEKQGRLFLKEADFVAVEAEDGSALPSVPKHWGEDQLAAGAKKVGAKSTRTSTRSTGSGSTSGSGGSGQGGDGKSGDDQSEPAGNASTEAWVKYATDVKGAKPEDLVDAKGEPLGRDDLKEKFGTPSGS